MFWLCIRFKSTKFRQQYLSFDFIVPYFGNGWGCEVSLCSKVPLFFYLLSKFSKSKPVHPVGKLSCKLKHTRLQLSISNLKTSCYYPTTNPCSLSPWSWWSCCAGSWGASAGCSSRWSSCCSTRSCRASLPCAASYVWPWRRARGTPCCTRSTSCWVRSACWRWWRSAWVWRICRGGSSCWIDVIRSPCGCLGCGVPIRRA